MARRGLTPEQEQKIIADYLSGEFLVATVAKRAGISKVAVYKVLHRTGTPLQLPPRRPPTPGPRNFRAAERRALTRKLFAEGLHPEEIVPEVGVTIHSVHEYLRSAREETADGLST